MNQRCSICNALLDTGFKCPNAWKPDHSTGTIPDLSEDLKPCPFCGGNARLWSIPTLDNTDIGVCSVSCENGDCRTATLAYGQEHEAIRIWNNRPVEDSLRAQLANKDKVIEAQAELVTALGLLDGDTINGLRRQASGPVCMHIVLTERQMEVVLHIKEALAKLDALRGADKV